MLKLTEDCIEWIRNHFNETNAKTAVIGVSGGKDSTICAALLKEALGAENVIGVLMPQGTQKDIDDSYRVLEHLDIKAHKVDIGPAFENLTGSIINGAILERETEGGRSRYMDVIDAGKVLKNTVINTNLPARLRMATLYSIAALYPNARVCNTSNMAEIYVGYSTKWGDGVGDFGPLRDLSVREVLMIGDDLGLPYDLVHKTPSDGMSGKSDEERLGVTYNQIDDYLLYVDKNTADIEDKIENLHRQNEHKINPIPCYHAVGRSNWL